MKRRTLTLTAALVVALAWAAEARAAIPRTYVSVTGHDANDCSRTSPCRSFAGAVPKTTTGGEITALDSGGYGIVLIDKALTLQAAPGVYAAVGDDLKRETQLKISAPADAKVVLRNLIFTARPFLQVPRGIEFNSGGALHVENCVVSGFKEYGIDFKVGNPFCDPPGCPRLFVKDSFVRGSAVGIGAQGAVATIEHCRVEDNATGVQINSSVKVTLRDSVVAANTDNGLTVDYNSTARVENCAVTDNGTGLKVFSDSLGSAYIYVSHTLISGNNEGLKQVHDSTEIDGKIYSFGNNRLYGNTADGTFTSELQQQ